MPDYILDKIMTDGLTRCAILRVLPSVESVGLAGGVCGRSLHLHSVGFDYGVFRNNDSCGVHLDTCSRVDRVDFFGTFLLPQAERATMMVPNAIKESIFLILYCGFKKQKKRDYFPFCC